MRKIFSIVIFCLTLWGTQGCQSTKNIAATDTAETKRKELHMIVASETRVGHGVGPVTCLLVKYTPMEQWQYMYSRIEGFNYEPGYEYQLTVVRAERENPPQDASKYVYKLVKVLSKEKKQSTELP